MSSPLPLAVSAEKLRDHCKGRSMVYEVNFKHAGGGASVAFRVEELDVWLLGG